MKQMMTDAGHFASAALVAFTLSICLAVGLPVFLGMQSRIVVSGSMEPQIRVGDIVVASLVAPSETGVGDVITFPDPEGSGKQFVHRVISFGREGNKVRFTTRGDANSSVERWVVPPDAEIGLVKYRVPAAGYVLVYMRHPVAQILLVAVPALILMVLEIRRIWAAPERREAGHAVKV